MKLTTLPELKSNSVLKTILKLLSFSHCQELVTVVFLSFWGYVEIFKEAMLFLQLLFAFIKEYATFGVI